MIYIEHHLTPPPQLKKRFDEGIPENPAKEWDSFKQRKKAKKTAGKELKENLSHIQNGLCVYCEIRLDTEIGSHLEHIDSKTANPPLTFEYTNIIASCLKDGTIRDNTDLNPVSCGHYFLKKNNLYNKHFFIKPTELNCESFFSYNLFGEIEPAQGLSEFDKQRAEHTIETLNLNALRLTRQRDKVINEGYEIIRDLKNQGTSLEYFLDSELNLVNNKYFSFINLRKEHFKDFLK